MPLEVRETIIAEWGEPLIEYICPACNSSTVHMVYYIPKCWYCKYIFPKRMKYLLKKILARTSYHIKLD